MGCTGSTRRPPVWVLVLVLWSGATAARAQTAALTGIVQDPSGRVAINAKVLVIDAISGKALPLTWTTTIGYYELELPPGDYLIHVEQNGLLFDGLVRVYPNEKTALDIELQYRGQEQLTVPSRPIEAETVEPAGMGLGNTFSRDAIGTLPLSNGRTLQSIQSLVPGIVITDSVGTLAQMTAMGQRRYANRLTIDGMNADLAVDVRGRGITTAGSGVLPAFATTGSTQTVIPLDAIEEITVRTTNAPSAQAQAPGAQTIVVTRAGATRFSGDLFADQRPTDLQAADWFTNASSEPRRPIGFTNLGASIGGPLVRRLSSLVTWERQRIDRPLAVHAQVPSLSTRNAAPTAAGAILDAFPLPNGPAHPNGLADFDARVPARSLLSTLSARLDVPLTGAHRLFARVNHGVSEGDQLSELRERPDVSYTGTEETATTTATTGLASTPGVLLHDFRANLTSHRGTLRTGPARYTAAQALPVDMLASDAPADAWVRVNAYAGAEGFIINGVVGDSTQTQMQVVDTWTWPHRAHEVQFGVDLRQLTTATSTASTRYTYAWPNLGALLYGPPRFITIDQVLPARARLRTWAVFGQDTWRVSPRTTLSYGLRASGQPAPASLTDTAPLVFDAEALPLLQPHAAGTPLWRAPAVNLSPRAGAVYQLGTATGRETLLRAGWTLTHDEATPPGAIAFGSGYPYVASTVIRPAVFPVPAATFAQAAALAPFTETTIADAYAFPARLRTPWTQEWYGGIDRALGRARRLSVAYVGAAGRDLTYGYPHYVDENHEIYVFTNQATSDYHALIVEYVEHATRLDARLAYTWSHALDLDSGELMDANLPPSVSPLRENRGSADFDRRHVFRGVLSYRVPPVHAPQWARIALADWQFDAAGMLISGAPVTVTTYQEVANGTYALRADRVAGVPIWIPDPRSPTGQAINPDAFQPPAPDREGTLGRNTLHASALEQLDVALSRTIRLNARLTLQCRVDAFNVLNVNNVSRPVSVLEDGSFGRPNQTYAEALGTGTLSYGGLVALQQVGGPRSIQLGLRLRW